MHTAAKGGLLKRIHNEHSTPEGVVEVIFTRVLSRRPTAMEMEAMLQLVAENQAPAVYEDIYAGLLASNEFLFNHCSAAGGEDTEARNGGEFWWSCFARE